MLNQRPIEGMEPVIRARNPKQRLLSVSLIDVLQSNILQCDGGTPCSACRAEKRKSRPCEYTKKARDIAAAREESNLRRQRDSNSSSSDEQYSKGELTIPGGSSTTGPALGPSSNPSASMHRKVSLCAIVEEVCLWSSILLML